MAYPNSGLAYPYEILACPGLWPTQCHGLAYPNITGYLQVVLRLRNAHNQPLGDKRTDEAFDILWVIAVKCESDNGIITISEQEAAKRNSTSVVYTSEFSCHVCLWTAMP